MAVNFPDSPSNGDTFVVGSLTYTYTASTDVWDASGVTSAAIQISDTAPSNPSDGELWHNSSDLKLYIYYNDGSSSQWVVASPQQIGPVGPGGSFSGTVSQSIIPDTDSAYDLGSATNKFRSLYLSSDTLYLGDSASISAGSGGEIILPSLKIGRGANAVRLEADAAGKLKTKKVVGGVTQAAEEPGNATVVTDMAGLIAVTGMSAGQTALVTALNKVFMYTGSAWFLIATMTNSSPTAITGVAGAYALAIDGTATTVTVASTDPEGFPLTFSHSVTAGSLTNGGGTTATVSQGTGASSNVFTITPTTTEAHAGTFSITFSVTDGATGAVNAVSAFTLVFTPPLPTSGLLGLYDMNDTNSYSGSGTSWNDVSGNSGPTFTIDTNFTSYINSSSGIGGIPALALETLSSNSNSMGGVKVVYHSATGLTNSSSPHANTVILIFAHRESRYYAGAYGQQTWYFLMSKLGQSYAVYADQGNTSTSLLVGAGHTGTWAGDQGAASSGSKLYIDKVDATAYTRQQVFNAVSDTNNKDKYHSIVLTDGLFYNGFSLNENHVNLYNSMMCGDLRAMVFYDRALSSSEIDDVHDHFASDYSSSEMIQ